MLNRPAGRSWVVADEPMCMTGGSPAWIPAWIFMSHAEHPGSDPEYVIGTSAHDVMRPQTQTQKRVNGQEIAK